MDVRKISDEISVGPQISEEHVRKLRELGFKTIICNRPDGESGDQPDFQLIMNAAAKAGLDAHHLPVVPGGITEHDIHAFSLALAEFPGPVFAYCRTGTRAAALWALTQAGSGADIEALLHDTSKAGCDLSAMRPLLEATAKDAVRR